jgi:hypothetical protein
MTALVALGLATAATATAASLPPYSGKAPFKCAIQDVGTGTDYPAPDADPFCVEFDKTNQNVTDFGIVDFLSQEPTRVGSAADKCFYFQRDHWTGSVEQGGDPSLWHWDGNYFFDKARVTGGVNVANFALGGQPMDASPYAPAGYEDYFGEGGGGNIFIDGNQTGDPTCAALVDTAKERKQVYRSWYRRALRTNG